MSANDLFVVYIYDERHVKNYVYIDYGRIYFDESPKKAYEFNYRKAAETVYKYGKNYGAGIEQKMTGYSEYLKTHKVDAADI